MRARARARAYVRGEGSDALRAYGFGRFARVRVREARAPCFVIFSQKSVKNFHKKIFEKVLKND